MSKEKGITYAEAILEKYKTHSFNLFKVKRKIIPLIQEFAGSGLADTIEMGSVIQGTDVKRGENDLDLDIMISLHHDIKYTLKEVHASN